MLHQTTIPWSPERMRRLIFSAICSSGNSANRLKPTSFDIHTLSNKDRLWRLVQQNAQVLSYENSVGAARPSSHHCGRAGSVWRTLWAPTTACNCLAAHAQTVCYNAQPVRSNRPNRRVQEPDWAPTTGDKDMTVYVIADVKVTDDRWVPAYAASVHDIVHKHGGKYLSRSGNVKTLEGKPLDTTLIALLQFPSAEAAEAFVSDPEYAPHAKARQSGSDSRFQLIDDTDLAGTIPYLAKG